ncbi:MAG: hypothetical protein JWR52_2229 [Marmoricola sp.]|nr:hypothetical protein [Marmoricola sp.]
MKFLFTRRWVLFAITVALLAWLAIFLGQWQFHRLQERRAANGLMSGNIAEPPVAIDSILRVGTTTNPDDEWRSVIVHGIWDDSHTIVLKYQVREGVAGVDVVTPLVTGSGAAVLVDRGWLATRNAGSARPGLPAADSGEVTVIGWVRTSGTGRATDVFDLETRAVSSAAAAKVLPYDFYGGFIAIDTENPLPSHRLSATVLPDDTSDGPHFFYGLQWWFFAVLAVFGFCYLAYDEWRMAKGKITAIDTATGNKALASTSSSP